MVQKSRIVKEWFTSLFKTSDYGETLTRLLGCPCSKVRKHSNPCKTHWRSCVGLFKLTSAYEFCETIK